MLSTEEIEGRLRPLLAGIIANYAHAIGCPACKHKTQRLEDGIALMGTIYEALGVNNDANFDAACDDAQREVERHNALIRGARQNSRDTWVGHVN